ncbi:ComEA family DNA-binding protein [uncultured Intestinimonas sp.]|uniref:ComEA family DNA-binding protein n=1 Tax=uncultured Intestinimonas sp. TaxID=1689265 RepID=UPI0025FFBA5E|nr:ComEA family DNA-binding protein [uncultured Intestinimonas sp.]
MPQRLWHILYQTRPSGAIGWRWVDIKISTLEKVLLAVTAAFLLLAAGYFLGARSGTEPYRVEALSPAAETGALPQPSEMASPAVIETASPAAEASAPAETAVPETGAAPDKVNINTASAQELETLPGIGEKRAADIVADRAANGPFRIPEDLTRVPGIGEGILEGLIDYITVE